jgi:type II secretory pathway pseudopilin PulG
MSANAKRQGMATSSLILGILSVMCLGLLAGLPAIVLGHQARRKVRTQPEQYAGDGLAMAGLVMGYASIFTTICLIAVLAGLALPALAKAKARAQSIVCINNLKQIGLAFRIYANDHQDRFPFNPAGKATKPAGLGEGASSDPVTVFEALANELVTPRLLICPADPRKHPATGFGTLQPSNVSYELEVGPEVKTTNPQAVLARCPIHGNELFCDGSVQQGRSP